MNPRRNKTEPAAETEPKGAPDKSKNAEPSFSEKLLALIRTEFPDFNDLGLQRILHIISGEKDVSASDPGEYISKTEYPDKTVFVTQWGKKVTVFKK